MQKQFFILFALIFFNSTTVAKDKIGVTAALSGEVIRLASVNESASIGQLTSGSPVYIGDDIKVSDGARLQVLLLDETVFTLGSGSQMVIDKFVYDPNKGAAELVTNITKGAFRFISGKVAKQDKDAMKVKIPSGIIGVRGTQVAGEIEDDGTSNIILIGPGINELGAPTGAITLTNDFGSVEITRPGFMSIMNNIAPPPTPVEATPEQIQQIEIQTLEDAETVIAQELGIDSIEIVPATDEDGDGFPDSIAANTQLGGLISTATEGSSATNDIGIIAATLLTLAGDQVFEASPEDVGEFIQGVNLGGGAAEVFGGGAKYLGSTTIDEFKNSILTGSTSFTANGVAVSCSNSSTDGCGGSYDVTDTWNFANNTYRQELNTGSGGIKLDTNNDGTNNVTLSFTIDKTIDLDDSFVTDDSQGAMVHLNQVVDDANVSTNVSSEIWVGYDQLTNNQTTSVFSTNTSSGSAGHDISIESTGYIDNFEMAGSSGLGNVASHDFQIRLEDSNLPPTKLAEGNVYGMEKQ